MPDFFKIGLLAYILYLPLFLFLIFFGACKQYGRYSIFTFWVSSLGEKKAASHYIFNVSFLILAFLSAFFLQGFFSLIPDLFLAKIALGFFVLSLIALILMVFAPLDRKPKCHEIITHGLFGSLAGFILFSINPIYVSGAFPGFLVLLNVIILFFSLLTTYTFTKLKIKYGAPALRDFVSVRKKEKSYLLKNAPLWEWITFISLVLWFFVSAIFVYLRP